MAHIEMKSAKVREMAERTLVLITESRKRKSAPFIEGMVEWSRVVSERNKTFFGRVYSFFKGEGWVKKVLTREEAHSALLNTDGYFDSMEYRWAAYAHSDQEDLCHRLIRTSELAETITLTERDVSSIS